MFFTKFFRHTAAILSFAVLSACASFPSKDQALLESAARIKADMAFLADDALKGREAGTPGYDMAADYVAKQFSDLGLEPAAADGTYFQEVKLRAFKRNPAKMAMSLTADGKVTELEYLIDFLPSNSSKYEEITITGDLVFVGYGLNAPEYGYTDYQGLDVKDKIVVHLGGMPKDIPSEISAHYNSTRMKMAGEAGAIAVLTVYAPGYERRLPWSRAKQYAKSEGVSWVNEEGQPAERSPGIKGSAIMSPKTSAVLFEGAKTSYSEIVAGLKKDAPVKPTGFDLGKRVSLSLGSTFRDTTSRNVVAKLKGSDPALQSEYVVFSAH